MIDSALMVAILVSAMRTATPLILAALGELVVEKAGCVNLGVEGMMLVGAVTGFAVGLTTGNFALAFLVGAVAGAGFSLIFGVLVLVFQVNQYAAGLALTILGGGASAFWGQAWQGRNMRGVQPVELPVLSDLPVIGAMFTRLDVAVYLAIAATIIVALVLTRTRVGLILRAVGENHDSAHALGFSVVKVRFAAIAFGGAMAGMGGAYLSCVITPLWIEGMTAGRGWIAVALVVFATWKPARLVLGAWLFGLVSVMQIHGQGLGLAVPSHVLAMLPYLVTIVVLVLISRDATRIRLNAPGCLGKPFRPTA
ncbi:ABC transporter permease [Roseinatronobacter sp. NSM]|uniref:ABC transporter permease n=1 Tax=Roseinatronobacter sp. NSM TaxID=3457785 RepID=UPI0040357F6A